MRLGFVLRSMSTGSGHRAIPRFHIPAHLTSVKYTPLNEDETYASCLVHVNIEQLDLPRDAVEYLVHNETKHLRSNGDLVVESALPKAGNDNKQICLHKIQHILDHAIAETAEKPDEAVVAPPVHKKDRWKDEKQHHSEIKQLRIKATFKEEEKESFRPHHSRFGPVNETKGF